MGEISELLFPKQCASCSAPNTYLCEPCKFEWSRKIPNRIDDLSLTSSAYYSSAISQVVLRAKENNDSKARFVLAQAIALHIAGPSVLIAIPSSKSSNRRRGYDHSSLLALQVAKLSGSMVWPALLVNRKIKDQTLLTHAQRFSNVEGAYSLAKGNLYRESIVLIDDLVTTGASIREALRALRGVEIRPVRAVSACIASHHLPNTISTVTF